MNGKLAREESNTGKLIPVDFKRRRRIGIRRCCVVRVTSFSQGGDGLVPRSFRVDSRLVLIWEVLDRWPAQDYRYFKVRSVDDITYFLRHDVRSDEWSVIE